MRPRRAFCICACACRYVDGGACSGGLDFSERNIQKGNQNKDLLKRSEHVCLAVRQASGFANRNNTVKPSPVLALRTSHAIPVRAG